MSTVNRRGELRHHRDAGHRDPLARDAAFGEPERHLVARDAVAIDVRMHPERVHVEIGDLDPERGRPGTIRARP
jgi:hypothetical protein